MTEITASTPTTDPAGVDTGAEILPPPASAAPEEKPDRITAVSNLAVGSLLMALEALDGWVDRNVPSQAEALAQRAREQEGRPPSTLLPQSEWEAAYGEPETDRTRLAIMGMVASGNTLAVRATRFAVRSGGLAVEAARWPLDHIFLFRPVRTGADRLAAARTRQINRWVEEGRALDTGSRAVAEVSLGRAAQDSVGVVTVEPHVQALVQEIITAQGTGIVEELINEVREHALSLDLSVNRWWASLRGRPQPAIAMPDFAVPLRGKMPAPKTMAGRPYCGGAYAGIASRVLAFSIDLFALMIALIIGVVFVWGVVAIFNLDNLFASLLGTRGVGLLRMISAGTLTTLAACAYWILGWTFIGGTVGKIVMGLRVVGPGGKPLGFWRSLRRVIGYFICAFSLGLGFLWLIVNRQRHTWADKLAGSSVVYAWHARPDETFLTAASPENADRGA
jgi:uncharacterized RDD family membrane protein YckC